MRPLLLSEIIDLVREGALAADGEVVKVRAVKPLPLPLEVVLMSSVVAYSVSAVKVTQNGHGFARHYIAIQTGDASGGMVEVDTGMTDEAMAEIAVRMLSGDGLQQVATIDIKV